tara:strand:+ start:49 stop:2166 length:2118 start_codon:yes stop_codon:yes gene_type:complete
MAIFKAFKPEGLAKIAKSMGYEGNLDNFSNFIEESPERQEKAIKMEQAAKMMAGGLIRMQEGGVAKPGVEMTPTKPRVGDETLPPTTQTIPQQAVPQQEFKQVTKAVPEFQIKGTDFKFGSETEFDNFKKLNPQYADTSFSDLLQKTTEQTGDPNIADISAQMLSDPGLPTGAITQAAQMTEQPDQMIAEGTGQLDPRTDVTATEATTTLATVEGEKEANKMTAAETAQGVQTALDATQAQQVDPSDPKSQVIAAEQTTSSVGDLTAAQGKHIELENPVQREIQDGELISGAADAEKAAKFTEQIQAATATPSEKTMVQNQLAGLTQDFDATNPPPWAAGALRGVMAAMAQRGLSASSMAGQAMVQAALESALPIAQADASTQASFEAQNLSNRQQMAVLAAKNRAAFIGQEFDQAFEARVKNSARIADVANQNFTAEQSIALENSRAANTMNLANLNNKQALVMAEAAALSDLDMANLNNRQQAAVHNAQAFMQRDMANLTNKQQTEMFKAQQKVQAVFTDTAAENAARQFNATSQNQTDQFFANLKTQTSQYNASQSNAQSQFNAGEANAMTKFNEEIDNQRDQFNANNQLVIAQNNAQWRRQIATSNTAAVNRANEINASAVLETSRDAYDNLWNYYQDNMENAWTSAEKQLDRYQELAIEQIRADRDIDMAAMADQGAAGAALGNMFSILGAGFLKSKFPF